MIIIRSPQQSIFDQLLIISRNMGNHEAKENALFRTYDYLPANGEKLPFVFIGEQFTQDKRTRRTLYGDVQQTIHIYGGYQQRREVTDILEKLKLRIIKLNKIGDMNINVRRTTGQTLIDNSNATTLLHGILEIELSFN